jgi:hypothetical protein
MIDGPSTSGGGSGPSRDGPYGVPDVVEAYPAPPPLVVRKWDDETSGRMSRATGAYSPPGNAFGRDSPLRGREMGYQSCELSQYVKNRDD